jgi:hypothetical protein
MSANGHEAETVTGGTPRQEALDLLDGAWNTRLAEAEHLAPGSSKELADTQLAAARITALIYIGDQIAELREVLVEVGKTLSWPSQRSGS